MQEACCTSGCCPSCTIVHRQVVGPLFCNPKRNKLSVTWIRDPLMLSCKGKDVFSDALVPIWDGLFIVGWVV